MGVIEGSIHGIHTCAFSAWLHIVTVWKNAQSLLSEVSQLLSIMIIIYLKKDGGLLSFRFYVSITSAKGRGPPFGRD